MIPLLLGLLIGWLPPAAPAPTGTARVDLDGDGAAELLAWYVNARSARGFLTIGDGYVSPVYPLWAVHPADLDGDRRVELVLGVWSHRRRHAEPQPHRTVWVLVFDGFDLVPDWRGSTLARPLVDAVTGDLDGDGAAELLALERLPAGCRLTAYRYTGFGFRALAHRRTRCEPLRLLPGGLIEHRGARSRARLTHGPPPNPLTLSLVEAE